MAEDDRCNEIFENQNSSATVTGIGDDSAPRAIDSYSGASMLVLQALMGSQGMAPQADAITSDVQLQNTSDDSAWRVAMHNEDGNMRLLLLLVAREDPAAAATMQSQVTTTTAGDDSALRVQAAYLQGKVDALHWLVAHP